MFVFLDTDDPTLIEQASLNFGQHYETQISEFFPIEEVDPESNILHIFKYKDVFKNTSVAEARYQLLAYASEASVLFSDIPRNESNNPLHVGNLAAGISHTGVLHLEHAMNRVDLKIDTLRVNYFGITYEDPKNVLVLDNKGWDKNKEFIKKILEVSPDNWWYNLGFMSTSNSAHLTDTFEDDFYYSTPVAMTDSAKSKLSYAGVDFKDASTIELDSRAGMRLRELTRRANDNT